MIISRASLPRDRAASAPLGSGGVEVPFLSDHASVFVSNEFHVLFLDWEVLHMFEEPLDSGDQPLPLTALACTRYL